MDTQDVDNGLGLGCCPKKGSKNGSVTLPIMSRYAAGTLLPTTHRAFLLCFTSHYFTCIIYAIGRLFKSSINDNIFIQE
jgi:hypothetical protein